MKKTKTGMDKKEMKSLTEIIKALSHSSRIEIMILICNHKEEKMTVKSLYDTLELPQPVISRHLGILKNSGLLIRISQGSRTFYGLNFDNNHVKHIANCFRNGFTK